jgi:hypothetical protein
MCAACVELDYCSSSSCVEANQFGAQLSHSRSKLKCWTLELVMVPQKVAQNDCSEHVLDVGRLLGAWISFGTVDASKRVRLGSKSRFRPNMKC